MEWPFSYNPEEDMISVNQRMVGMLINRESILKERSIKDKRLAKAFGRGVGRFRDQIPQARIECAAKVGLDSGFLALVESGDSLIEEISAASIIAKVIRDTIMIKYEKYFKHNNINNYSGLNPLHLLPATSNHNI